LKIFLFCSSTNDAGADGVVGTSADDQEVEFPHMELARLDEMINRPRWVVPVLHNGELEILLDASIALCKAGLHSCRDLACSSLIVRNLFRFAAF